MGRIPTKCLNDVAPHLVCELHPNKNGDFSPFEVSSFQLKLWWKCSKSKHDDHVWQATINNRYLGNGCPCCTGLKVVPSNCLETTHPELSKEWHPKNSLTPKDVNKGSNKKVLWKCHVSNDHEWQAEICNRTRGIGCPCCAGLKVVLSNCLQTTHPELSKEWHPTKNSPLTTINIRAGNNNKFWWKCKKGHEWKASGNHRINGRGCPICSESRGEKRIANFLSANGYNFERQKRFESCRNKYSLPFDFYLELNGGICIEYQGKQHYDPFAFGGRNPEKTFKKIKINDQIKLDWSKNNTPLLIIPYWDFNNIETILDAFIKRVS